MFEALENIDRDLLLAINGANAPWLDHIMWYISQKWLWIPLYLFILYFIYKRTDIKTTIAFLAAAGLCVAIADLVSVHLFKNMVMRYRPTHNLEIADLIHTYIKSDGHEYRGGMYGFVSSHAANHTALATFVFFRFRQINKHWAWLFLWAAVIGYSRIYLGVHYPSDVICGSILGIGAGYLVHRLYQRLYLNHLSSYHGHK